MRREKQAQATLGSRREGEREGERDKKKEAGRLMEGERRGRKELVEKAMRRQYVRLHCVHRTCQRETERNREREGLGEEGEQDEGT